VLSFKEALIAGCALGNSPFFLRVKKSMKAKKVMKAKKTLSASASTGASSSSAAAATEEDLREQRRDARLERARGMSTRELGEELLNAWEAIASLESEVSVLRRNLEDLRSLLARHLGDGIADLRVVVDALRRA
jgi:hypothetical protein